MKIVCAGPEQLPAVLELLEEYYTAVDVEVRDTPAQVNAYLHDRRAAVWLADADGVWAGCVLLRPLDEEEASAECKRLYVRPQFRGRKIAGALLDAMEAWAVGEGLRWIYLDSKDDLQEAIALYRNRDYQDCARYNANPQATVFLRKRLAG